MYLTHLHNFRGVAICGIVGAHALHNFTWNENSLAFNFFDTLFNQSSIWFFFIAGFLFQYLSPKFRTLSYYITKLKNVILPYLIMSIPALYYFTQMAVQNSVPEGFYDYSLLSQIILLLVTGKHLAPFWFVPTITIIYAIAPVLLLIDRSKWGYVILLPLLCLSAILGRDGLAMMLDWSPYFSPLSKAFYLLSVYLMGMFCGKYHKQLLDRMAKYHIAFAILAILAFALNMFDAKTYYLFSFKIITSILLVYYLFKMDEIIGNKLKFLGTISFGLFFIHGYVLGAITILTSRFINVTQYMQEATLTYLFFTFIVIAFCSALLWIAMKTLGKKSRMVVGC